MTSTDPRTPGRSQAFFERYPGETTAERMPVQELGTPEAYAALSVAGTPLARGLLRLAFLASGFSRFHRHLPRALDQVVEDSYHNIGATGPTVAATMALRDATAAMDPFVRAAAMLEACWDLHAQLRAGTFPADQHRGAPLEMRQYLNLFGTSTAFDGERLRLFKSPAVSRVLVLARGVPHIVDFGAHPAAVPRARLAAAVEAVWRRGAAVAEGRRETAAGWLTCLPVPVQVEQLRRLLQDASCAQSYEQMKHTFVTLCLDLDEHPETDAAAGRLAQSGNCGNRWFHASLQLVVFGNAKAAVICDFNAGLGGNTMMRAAAEISRRSSAPRAQTAASTHAPEITSLSWGSACAVDAAIGVVDALLDSQEATFELTGRGRMAFAAHGLDPVPAFATAVQLAVWRLTGRFARVRQFVSQAKFVAHNVALALVSTPEVRAAVEALNGPHQGGDAGGLLRTAIESQRQQIRRARSYASVARSLQLYRSRQRGLAARYVELVLNGAFRVLRARNLVQPPAPTDVVLSHPDVFLEVPVMGRPGVRLPYVGCFGLHYFMRDDRTTVTVMPSTRWTVPNAELITALEASLDRLFAAAAARSSTDEDP